MPSPLGERGELVVREVARRIALGPARAVADDDRCLAGDLQDIPERGFRRVHEIEDDPQVDHAQDQLAAQS